MTRAVRIALALVVSLGACTEGTGPTSNKNGHHTVKQQMLHADAAGVSQGGNDFYQVFVTNTAAAGIGQYTVMTGSQHPVTLSTGSAKNVLFGDGAPGTSYNTIHSYTSGTDYVNAAGAGGSLFVLDPTQPGVTATVTAIGTTGFRTTYTLSGPPNTPDALTIVQDVNTHGTTFETATVEVTTTITNNGGAPVQLGLR